MQKTLHVSDEMSINGSGEITGGFLPPFSNEWAWTQELATNFNIEGITLAEFLHWFAQQSGYAVSFASDRVHSAANGARLHGSIAGLSARDALEAVIATTNLRFDLTPLGECRINMREDRVP